MYFPHLFARRAELLALRDVCEDLPIAGSVVPILEPILSNSSDLRTCMTALGTAEVEVAIITNPHLEDFQVASHVSPWRVTLDPVFVAHPSLLPSFVCRAGVSLASVQAFLALYPDRDVAVLYWSTTLTTAELTTLINVPRIKYHINLHNQLSAVHRALLPPAKAVDVVDHFIRLVRNADYADAEFFSDDHLTFGSDSVGFGDNSIIGFQFIKGGGRAHAVVIHAVYRKPDSGAIWVEHFVSDDTDIAVGTPESKLLQAAVKLNAAVIARPTEFGHDAALGGYASDVAHGHSSGLMTSKRRQIHHHIALVYQILHGTL